MNKFTVEFLEQTGTFEVVKWLDLSAPGKFKAEVIYKSNNFETANSVCDSMILDSDPAYQLWAESQY